jgi:NAD(P)-dependent dehydrogenase (short-subunit alcohol dehydrogenase family)
MRVGPAQRVRAVPLPADVSDPAAVERAVAATAEAPGALDGLVTTAPVDCAWAPTGEMDLEEWARTVAVNLSGGVLLLPLPTPASRRGRPAGRS